MRWVGMEEETSKNFTKHTHMHIFMHLDTGE